MPRKIHLVLFAVFALFLFACASQEGRYPVPAEHPEELGPRDPICTECHDAESEGFVFARFNHVVPWLNTHRFAAYQNAYVCNMCHQTSFCNDCHVTTVEMKPSVKNQTETYRKMPHRGDYLSRHRIDGRIDPTSCFRCHGNPKASKTCTPCHG